MSQKTTEITNTKKPEVEIDGIDGRRARSERSRQKIIEAVLKLVLGGNIHPGAERVAEVAEVSLRTVYRHFEDMESLYKEIARACDAKFLPIFMRPYQATDWKGRLSEHLDRRLQTFAETMYLRMCTNARRFQSESLMQNYERTRELERSGIAALIPAHLQDDTILIAALDIVLSFETYHRLRVESGHSPAKTKEIMGRMLNNTLREMPD